MSATFSDETFTTREARVREMMARRGLAALIVYGLMPGQNDNVQYLAGEVTTNSVLFFPAEGEAVLFVQPKALVPFVARLARCEVRNGGIDYAAELIDQIQSRGLSTAAIGLVEIDTLRTRGIPHLLYLALAQHFPHARFETVTQAFERVRMLLLPEERARVEGAAHELDRIMDYFTAHIRPGPSVTEVAKETAAFAAEQGLTLGALWGGCAALDGSTSLTDPDRATRPIRRGDHVHFESFAGQSPYRAYRGFPILLGEPSPGYRTLFDTALEIARHIAGLLAPGRHTSELAAAGDVLEGRDLMSHGPLAMAMGTGGWQMISARGFDGYPPPEELTFEPGMVFSVFPHLCDRSWTKIVILGNNVMVDDHGSHILGSQGLRYLTLG